MPPARAVAVRGRADPKSDPRYTRVVDKLDADSRKLKQHPPAKRKAQEPQKAAKGPPDERQAGARARQVGKLEAAKTPKPQPTTFLAILQAEIAKAMPKTLGDTEKFMKGGSSEGMKGSLKGNVDQQKDKATGDLKQTSAQTPNEAGIPGKPVTPIPPEPGTPAPQVDAAGAMPAPKPAAEVSLDASKQDVAGQMKREKLTDDRLKKANDPRFSSVLSTRDAVNKQADAGPAKYRAAEAGTLARAAGAAVGVATKGVSLLLGVKGGSKTKVLTRQQQQKLKEEQELKTFTDFVKKTFEDAKAAVEKRLNDLETKVNDMFDKGVDRALANMKDYVETRLRRYKLERYLLRVGGSLLWIKDQILDLPDEVNVFYEDGRRKFTAEMNALAVQVANVVESELAAAKNEVAQAQGKITAAQKALSPAVQGRAAKVTAEFTEKFAELQQGIEDKKQQLAEGLAQKYKEAFGKADEALKAIQEENKGLVTRAKEAIGEVIKALREFKEKLMGILRKAQNAIELILNDPIQFLKNLLAAIKQGFGQFVDNIWTHLKAGFFKWLFGALEKLGIELPKDLSLPSILKLVLGVLGITYASMRAKAVKLIGPRAVAIIEKAVEYIGALIKGGPAALWEKVKEDLGSLKEMVIDAIQNWLITTIVKKAVAKIVSMFNPVGAIIQAILLIYDVVSFIITKATQILEFVEAVVDSIYNIATGAIGGAANYIEKALANMIPLLIGFLADLLGLGGISEKIKEFIKKVQDKVDKAIDKAIAKVVDVVKKLFGKIKAGAKALLEWWKKKLPIAGGGENHTLEFEGKGKSATLLVRSTPKLPSKFLEDTARDRSVPPKKSDGPVKTTKKQEGVVGKIQTQLAAYDDPDKAAAAGKRMDEADKLVKDLDAALKDVVDTVGDALKDWNADGVVAAFDIPRESFTVGQKEAIAAEHESKKWAKAGDVRKDKEGRKAKIRRGWARRHVVSSFDIARHYPKALLTKAWSAAKLVLEQRSSIVFARIEVKKPLSQENVVAGAKERYKNFFGYVKNIFLGNSRENSQIQEHLDAGNPDLAGKLLENHVHRIEREWALDEAIEITPVRKE
jgi:phage-related protein